MIKIKQNIPIIKSGKNSFQQVEYKKPVTLKRALYDIFENKEINCGIMDEKQDVKQFLDDLKETKIGKRKIKRVIGSGSSSIAFETPMGDILKISHSNPFIKNRPVQDFDAEIYKRGKHNTSYYILEEKLDKVDFMEDDNPVADVVDKIEKKGFDVYDLWDVQTWQVGRSKDGELKLLDHECARYKSWFHRIKTVIKQFLGKS